jgi:hypothetical protein
MNDAKYPAFKRNFARCDASAATSPQLVGTFRFCLDRFGKANNEN